MNEEVSNEELANAEASHKRMENIKKTLESGFAELLDKAFRQGDPLTPNPCGEISLSSQSFCFLQLPGAAYYQIGKISCEIWLEMISESIGTKRAIPNAKGYVSTFTERLAVAIKAFIRTHATKDPEANWTKFVDWEKTVRDFWENELRKMHTGFVSAFWSQAWKDAE